MCLPFGVLFHRSLNSDLGFSRTGSVPCDRGVGKVVREADLLPPSANLCLYQASSRGGGCNLARFGSPEPGLGFSSQIKAPWRMVKSSQFFAILGAFDTKIGMLMGSGGTKKLSKCVGGAKIQNLFKMVAVSIFSFWWGGGKWGPMLEWTADGGNGGGSRNFGIHVPFLDSGDYLLRDFISFLFYFIFWINFYFYFYFFFHSNNSTFAKIRRNFDQNSWNAKIIKKRKDKGS